MQSSQRHLGQSIGMVVLLAMTCVGFIAIASQMS